MGAASNADNKTNAVSDQEYEEAVRTILRWIGDDPDRPGLKETPDRMRRAYREMFQGYGQDPAEPLSRNFSHGEDYSCLPILVRNIAVRSFCEHHMLPIVGRAHVAYWPNKHIPGLSKIARSVDAVCRRLQSQEAITRDIAQAIKKGLQPRGVMVVTAMVHHCMLMRGVGQENAVTEVMISDGIFAKDTQLQQTTWHRLTDGQTGLQ